MERLPRLADGSTLSAATALGFSWPPMVLLGTCWVTHLDTAFGHDPISFPMSCLLGGARTVVGATGPLHDAVASELFAGSTADVLDGHDLWTNLATRLRRNLRNPHGDAAVPAAGPGVAFWTLQPPVAPASATYSTFWNRDGAAPEATEPPASRRPRSGNELLLPAASNTLSLGLSISVTDPVGRWDDFFEAPGARGRRSASSLEDAEPTVDVELPGGRWIEVTASVATVLHLAELLRRYLGDESVHLQHAMHGLVHVMDSNAHERLGLAQVPRVQMAGAPVRPRIRRR